MENLTAHLLMVRPHRFRKNEQTATNNFYQKALDGLSDEQITARAHNEFDHFVQVLRNHGIRVSVYQDPGIQDTPDALFPNNWVSFHREHQAIFYPMYAPNRRLERTVKIFEVLKSDGVDMTLLADFSIYEKNHQFLEGTGSMVLDRQHKIAYAALSERTDPDLLVQFCDKMGYKPLAFNAYQTFGDQRLPIYHTNVMMSIGPTFAMVCFDAIDDPTEVALLKQTLAETHKEVVILSEKQIEQFSGNALTLQGRTGPLLIMSSSGYKALDDNQKAQLNKHATLIHSPLPTIESCGGGSARCMMAEVF